jgi:hypothetical protein
MLIQRPSEEDSELKIVENDKDKATLKQLDQGYFMFDEVGIFFN